MAYVQVDVDLDEFETYELVDELVRRFKSYGKKQITDEQKSTLKIELNDLIQKLSISAEGFEVKSLDDKMKVDIIMSVWNKYTSWQFEEKLKP